MNDVIELFKKPLIPASVDAAWTDKILSISSLASAPMLVLARPYEAGSKEEATLVNMLKACGFAADAASVLQVNEADEFAWSRIRAVAQPTYALLLGVPPAQLGISARLQANMAAEFAGVTFIWTSTLQHLAATEAARKALWVEVLQPLFKKG